MEALDTRVETLELTLGRFILETERSFSRLERLIERSEKRAEIDRERTDIERQRAEKDRQRAEEDRQRAEKDRQRAEEDRKRSDADRRAWNKKWGELANKLGTIVEDIVVPNLPRIAQKQFGCRELDDFMIRRQIRNKADPSKRREFDLIAVCGDKFIVNETKSKVSVDYINSFIEVLPRLGDYFPEHRGKELVPVFSSLYISEDLVNYLSRHGIYAMSMGDETMELVNANRLKDHEPIIV